MVIMNQSRLVKGGLIKRLHDILKSQQQFRVAIVLTRISLRLDLATAALIFVALGDLRVEGILGKVSRDKGEAERQHTFALVRSLR